MSSSRLMYSMMPFMSAGVPSADSDEIGKICSLFASPFLRAVDTSAMNALCSSSGIKSILFNAIHLGLLNSASSYFCNSRHISLAPCTMDFVSGYSVPISITWTNNFVRCRCFRN